jgi:S-DNA-T family DNA segregation ATPase FtsK/SpoIIIE
VVQVGTTLVKRPARIAPPQVSGEQIQLAEPPRQQQTPPAATGAGVILMPLMAGTSAVTMALTAKDRPLIAVVGLLFFVGIVGFAVVMIVGQRSGPRRQTREARERYLDYVEDLRRQLRRTINDQKANGTWRHPAPDRLLDLSRLHARRWERRTGDGDFLVLRAGTGDQPVATGLTMGADEGPLNEFDPVCLEAAQQLRTRYTMLHDQPVCLDLRDIGVLSVLADEHGGADTRALGRTLARALVAQLVTFHSPQDVLLAVVRAEQHAQAWDWAKWLPHTQHPNMLDGDVPARLIATGVPSVAELLQSEVDARLTALQRRRGQRPAAQRHLVVVVDGEDLRSVLGLEPPDPSVTLADLGIHVIMLLGSRREEPERVDERVRVAPDGTAVVENTGWTLRIDDAGEGLLPALARQLAPLRMLAEEAEDRLSATVGLPEILGVADPAAIEPANAWRARPFRDFLRVPIGIGADGRPVMLDLKESAHGGMGPHGLIVGATGSGKSEMLRTLVSSIVINHPPDRLALMLVDFKGGATFAGMSPLPHLAGMITNLQDDLTLVDRMRDALFGEMQRRQEILRKAGNLPNVSAYQEMRDAGQPLEPLPHLLVIVDEFSELLTAKPDFADLFVAIGRIGRSIGVHLLLATQRLDAGKIRGLESHLSYRIGLRTFSAAESQEVIGVADAYHLPPEPGSGYLKVDTTVFERFKAALVSAPYRPPDDAPKTVVPVVPYLSLNGLGGWLAKTTALAAASTNGDSGDQPARAGEQSVLDVIVDRLSRRPAGTEGTVGTEKVRPVWLDPLPDVLPLDRVQEPSARAAAGSLTAVLGLVDEPSRQREFPLEWDFTGGGGNLVVVGAPQSGKSTLLRSLITSLSLRYAPGDVAFYCVDYGGGSLSPLGDLPHVAGVATRVDGERVRRVVGEVLSLLDAREELFREYGVDSAAALRVARAAGEVPADVPGDVFFVVDGWGSFRDDFEALEMTLGDAAARGLNYGVHFVLTVTQTMQIRMRMQAAFGGRIELRLNDPYDSQFDRKVMQQIAKETPGRGLIEGPLQFQCAVPRVDGVGSLEGAAAAQKHLVRTIGESWPDGRVATVQVLPVRMPAAELPPVEPGDPGVPVGISEQNLAPVGVDLSGSDPHLLVYGDGETGKTNLLHLLMRGHLKGRTPDKLGIVLVDYRRTLLDTVPEEYLLAYCTAQQQTATVAAEIAGSLKQRLPGPDVTSDQLRNRSWWKGLDVLFVVDDYDLVATQSANPLLPLLEYVPQARDLGLHVVLARRTGGMSRALLDPLIQRMNDLSTPGFLFSGDRMEGRLINGVAAQRLPPGRALYAGRGGASQQVQIALLEGEPVTP